MARNPDTLPTKADLCGKCPRCGCVSNFELANSEILRLLTTGGVLIDGSGRKHGGVVEGRAVEHVSVIKCMGCGGKSVVIEAEVGKQYGLKGVLWWPTEHLADLEEAAGVPSDIIESYSEGVRCLAVQAPHAAGAMFRTTIARIVKDKGSEAAKSAKTLNLAINQMIEDRTLFEDFGDWAHHIRDTGNAGAHGEKFDPIDMDQAEELRNFIRELINFLYVQPARRAAARPPTKSKAQPATPQDA